MKIDNHTYTRPGNDKRPIPYGAPSAPYDEDNNHWRSFLERPRKPGYYAVAIEPENEFVYQFVDELPVEKAYYDGRQWSRRRCAKNSMLKYKISGQYVYAPYYWCKITDENRLPRCILDLLK